MHDKRIQALHKLLVQVQAIYPMCDIPTPTGTTASVQTNDPQATAQMLNLAYQGGIWYILNISAFMDDVQRTDTGLKLECLQDYTTDRFYGTQPPPTASNE